MNVDLGLCCAEGTHDAYAAIGCECCCHDEEQRPRAEIDGTISCQLCRALVLEENSEAHHQWHAGLRLYNSRAKGDGADKERMDGPPPGDPRDEEFIGGYRPGLEDR